MRWSFYIIYNLPLKLGFKADQTSIGLFQPEALCEFKIFGIYLSSVEGEEEGFSKCRKKSILVEESEVRKMR